MTTVSGLAGAMGSLGAAAGPLGMILGTVVAGGVLYFSNAAREAEKRSEDFRAELERMGLYAPKVVEANEEVAKSIDNLTDEERLRKIRLLREGLDALRGGGLFESSDLDQVMAKAREGIGLSAGYINIFGSEFESGDKQALERVREIGLAWQANTISAQDFLVEAQKVNELDMSQPAQDLLDRLISIAEEAAAGSTALSALGGAVEIDEANDKLQAMSDELTNIRDMGGIDANVVDAIQKIIAAAKDGSMSAEDAYDALEAIADANPDAAGFIGRLGPILGALITLKNTALQAAAAVAAASQSSVPDSNTGRHASDRADRQESAAQAYIAEKERLNSLTRDQLALEKEVERVRKDALDAGVVRITLSGSARIGVIYAGAMMEMREQALLDATPLEFTRTTIFDTNRSQTGQFMGRSIVSSSRPFSVTWPFLSRSWYQATFLPFALAARFAPFFIAIRPVPAPEDVGYAVSNEDIVPSPSGRFGQLNVSISCEAHMEPTL